MKTLGEKIKERRKEIGMSIRQLARSTGLSASFISLIETNKSNPSVESLRVIGSALGVAPFYFLVDGVKNGPVVRKGDRTLLTPPGYNQPDELLSHDLNRKMEVFIAKLPSGHSNSEDLRNHQSEEIILVLEGIMELALGDTKQILLAGDSAYIDGPTPHRITAIGDQDLRWYAVVNPPVF